MNLEELEGKRVGFCGVDNLTFCLVTEAGERLAFEAVEDEADGYRSMLAEVKAVPLEGLIFFRTPVAEVTVQDDGASAFDGWRLVDDGGHVWLRLGTDGTDDYYPMFAFRYDPPKDVCVKHDDCRGEPEMARTCGATPGAGGESG